MFKTHNNMVALSQFPERHVKSKVESGFAVIQQKVDLQELTVMAESNDFKDLKVGDKVFVRGEMCVHKWAKEALTVSDIAFILCPKEFILVHVPKA